MQSRLFRVSKKGRFLDGDKKVSIMFSIHITILSCMTKRIGLIGRTMYFWIGLLPGEFLLSLATYRSLSLSFTIFSSERKKTKIILFPMPGGWFWPDLL